MNKALLLIFLLLTLVACKDETEEESREIVCSEISEEVKCLMFKSGSHWVYIDSISAVIDAVEVVEVFEGQYKNSKFRLCWDECKIDFRSSTQSEFSQYYRSGIISVSTVSNYGGDAIFSSYETPNTIVEEIDTYSVGSDAYSGVFKVTSLPDYKLEKEQISYYKEGVGLLVKQVYDQGQMIENWILTESNVTPYW